ncbi:MAG: Transcriptional regulator, GntR family domain / Aspartate aminotransferase [uncultured Thermomicrobiales bacterium]|uniref:Transcriptional regulator, GntR family domain / Aspartate aminotransferase n=1 Tax=uncultured Thermomicrobiales bacterium TaxID=1645740 RepID=A0A6J4UEI8_9BACT|nr:MAG: Transcriptional regulator, GntR family domain / Aspartate aminotransferase [uncultured Thermomicrobiales bacterium]
MDILLSLDRRARQPLRDQLYDALRAAILAGEVPPGAKLPSTRAIAAQVGVARFTAEDSYARLVADGYAVGRHGAGTFVAPLAAPPSAAPDDASPPSGPDAGSGRSTPTASATTPRPGPHRPWSAWGRRVADGAAPPVATESPPFAFRHGTPALDAFPHALWRRLQTRAAREAPPAELAYGPAHGLPALREAIAAYLARARGLRCGPDQIVVTAGTQQAIDLLARLWLDPGDAVAVENPGYPSVRRVLAAAGAALRPVPVDGDGLRVDLLDDLAPGAKLVHVTPSHQYPTGAVLPLARRLTLLAWARRRGALVVEDDYDGEFRYGGHAVPALAGLDAAAVPGAAPGPNAGPLSAGDLGRTDAAPSAVGSVVYVGSFSKVLYPGLRLGYAVLPPDLVAPFAAAKALTDRQAPAHAQRVLAAFIAEGHFERHLARMRRLYAARRAALLAGLDAHLAGVAARDPAATAAGLHILVRFDVPYDERALVARATRAGVGLDAAGACFAAPPAAPAVLLGYAPLPEDRIDEGLRRLAGALRHP